ncbi:hypothetical protein [Streptomyces sp. NPDC001422]|uniref:hypothetical protein n=1 Tax=Streptomyces sp. NPDC001422 TaxID=3364575 RepID=UPI00367CBBCA
MTKSGNDHHKRQARRLRADGPRRRFPDLLAELSSRPVRRPSTDLVLLCSGLAHPLDGGRCAREAGHEALDGDRSWCSPKPNLPVHSRGWTRRPADCTRAAWSWSRPNLRWAAA